MSTQNDLQQAAIFIDVANCRNVNFKQVLDVAREHGELVILQAYGNFANSWNLGEAVQTLFVLGVRLIHCPAWRNGFGQWKSTDDETLMNDIRTLLYTDNRVNTFIICSGDGHYVPTLLEIKKQGKQVIVMADPEKASRLVKEAATKFISLVPVATPIPGEIFKILVKAVHSLQKTQCRSAVPSGNIKVKMIELLGQFDEKKYRDGHDRPFRQFAEFLKEAQSAGWIRLIQQNNGFLVTTAAELSKAA